MSSSPRDTAVYITSGTIIRSILFVLLVVLLFYLRDLVLIVLTAVVIASAIEPAAQWFIRYRVPRVLSVLLVYLIIVSSFLGLFYFFVPPLLDEALNFLAILPQYIDSATISNQITPLSGGEVGNLSLRDLMGELRSSLSNVSEGFIQTVSSVFGGVLSFILIIVFSFYFAVQETGVDDFLRLITPVKHQPYVISLWKRSHLKIGRWMQGQLILGLIIGVLVYLGLTVLGIKYALLLAVLAALFELIPVFGPILSAVPAVGFGFLSGGVSLALLVIGLYLIIQQFENHLIYPLVVKKVVGVPPLLVILALIIGAKLAGFLGVILSVPFAAVIQEFVSDVQREKQKLLEKEV